MKEYRIYCLTVKVQDLGMNPGEDEKVQTNLTIRADLSVGAANKLGILKDVVGWWKEHKGL